MVAAYELLVYRSKKRGDEKGQCHASPFAFINRVFATKHMAASIFATSTCVNDMVAADIRATFVDKTSVLLVYPASACFVHRICLVNSILFVHNTNAGSTKGGGTCLHYSHGYGVQVALDPACDPLNESFLCKCYRYVFMHFDVCVCVRACVCACV